MTTYNWVDVMAGQIADPVALNALGTAVEQHDAALALLFPVFAAVKSADGTPKNNDTSFADDPMLFVPLGANRTYFIYSRWLFNSGATPDLKAQWTYPAGLTMSYDLYGIPVGGSTLGQFPSTETTVQLLEGGATDRTALIQGIVHVGSTAGNLQLQWAQNTANVSNTYMKANSFIWMTPIS